MREKEQSLFEAIDVAYNAQDTKEDTELREILMRAAKSLNQGDKFNYVAERLSRELSAYSSSHGFELPSSAGKVYKLIAGKGYKINPITWG